MGKFVIVVAILGAAGYFGYKYFVRSDHNTCTRMAELCGKTDIAKCEADVAKMKEGLGAEPVDKMHKCVATASSCAEALGCGIGAGVSALPKLLEDAAKGMEKALKN